MNSPTGTQHTIRRDTPLGEATATITQMAASLRQFSIGGVDVAQPYAPDIPTPIASGIVLVPWPNRVRDGKWQLHGKTQQLDITDVSRNTAIHGLLRNTGYEVIARTDASITLCATVYPQHGYPFLLETRVTYTLVDDGLDVLHEVRNLSDAAAPVAVGTHPFFRVGDTPVADLTLTVNAATVFHLDERLLPAAEVAVEGASDLRGGVRVGDVTLDGAYGTIEPGIAATLADPSGRAVSLIVDEHFRYVQAYTTTDFPQADGSKGLAIALEPMTAPADAFNSGQHLEWVAPGETFSPTWGVRYSA